MLFPESGSYITRFQAAWRETEKQGCEQEVSSLRAALRLHRHLFPSKTQSNSCLPPTWPIPGLTSSTDSLGLSSFEFTIT